MLINRTGLRPLANSDRNFSAEASGTAALDESLLPEWRLEDLYASMDAPELAADFERAHKQSVAFEEKWKGKLAVAASKGQLGIAVQSFEELQELMGRIGSYAGLLYTGDTSDPERVKFYGDAQQRLTDASSHLLFFGLELNLLEDEQLQNALRDDALAAKYRPWLEDLRKEKPFQLEDRVEQLFHEKALTSSSAFNRLFDETTNGLRFVINGDELPLERAFNHLQDANETRRATAFKSIAAVFKENIRTFSLITNTLAKDKEISDRWRGFEDVADSRHLDNRVEREVVDALVAAVRESYPRISHRYYAMKAKWLGMDKLQAWDRNAPLPETPDALVEWPEAKNVVLSAYHGFLPEMADIARQFFDKNWIDAPAREGKAPGAFAHPTVPSAHPYVLLNYLGKPRDVMTLAHELGHGVHQVLAGDQGALMASTPLTLAETASVFGEMLTFRSMLDKVEDRRERKAMLAQKAEDMINTVVRQIAFYQFERKVHEERRNGEITVEQLGQFWMEVQSESLGPAVELNDGYENFWAYIPHFIHSPFYVYAYAFGDCLVNSLYAVYQNSESGFQDKYMDMLKAGGTKHHSALLAPFGLDATDPDFWKKGLSVIESIIDELEAMDD